MDVSLLTSSCSSINLVASFLLCYSYSEMGSNAARPKRTTIKDSDPAVDYLASLEIKQKFVGTVLTMGWRLALTFLIPVILGAWLDRRFDTSPSYTLTGLFIAIIGSVMVVTSTVKEVNAETAELDKKPKKRKKYATPDK